MPHSIRTFLLAGLACCAWSASLPAAAQAQAALPGRLASAAWLKDNLARGDLLVIDASPAQLHRKGHIPGAINADLFVLSPKEVPLPQMEARLRSWGISPQTQIVIADQGGTYMPRACSGTWCSTAWRPGSCRSWTAAWRPGRLPAVP